MTLPPRYVLPVFLLIVFLGPVILGPLLNLALEPFGIPFHRVMSRALLISALGALVLFRRHLRLNAWWPRGRIAWRQIGLGFGLAIASALAMIGFYFVLCGFQPAHLTVAQAAAALLTALLAALIVPVLEETIFRGFLVTILVQTTGRWIGWFLAALIYALAHFLRVPSGTAAEPVHFWSGAAGMISIFTHLGQGDFIGGRGLNLFLVGLILGGLFLHTRTLWVNAALHSGWILILMTFSAFTRPLDSPHLPIFRGDLLANPVTSIVLVLFGAVLWLCPRMPSSDPNPRRI